MTAVYICVEEVYTLPRVAPYAICKDAEAIGKELDVLDDSLDLHNFLAPQALNSPERLTYFRTIAWPKLGCVASISRSGVGAESTCEKYQILPKPLRTRAL